MPNTVGPAQPWRNLRPELLLIRNIRALLDVRRLNAQDLAEFCGHRGAWISKILDGTRGVRVGDLGQIAEFFGLTVAQLFHYGIDPLLERRRQARRKVLDRRSGTDRRVLRTDVRGGVLLLLGGLVKILTCASAVSACLFVRG